MIAGRSIDIDILPIPALNNNENRSQCQAQEQKASMIDTQPHPALATLGNVKIMHRNQAGAYAFKCE